MFMRSTYVPNPGSDRSETYGIDMLETDLVIWQKQIRRETRRKYKDLPKAECKKQKRSRVK